MAPDREDGIPDEFIDRATTGENIFYHQREVFVELSDQLSRCHFFCHGGEVAQVSYDERDLGAFTAKRSQVARRIVEYFADDIFGHVGLQGAPNSKLLDRFVSIIVDK